MCCLAGEVSFSPKDVSALVSNEDVVGVWEGDKWYPLNEDLFLLKDVSQHPYVIYKTK